jgi:hypothetical protein
MDQRDAAKDRYHDGSFVADEADRAHPQCGPGRQHSRAGLGGILAVTNRLAVRVRVTAASAALGLPAPVFVDDLTEVLERGLERAVLLLDLGSCCEQSELVSLVQIWAAFHPGSEVVVFTPLLERELELKATVALVREVRSAEVRVLTTSDFYRDEVWRNLGEMRQRAALHAELRADLLSVVHSIGRPLPAARVVFQMLADAARPDDPRATADAPAARMHARERKSIWKLLRRSGQLPASWLLLVFRVLWYAKLRSEGWSARQIAAFLGFETPRHFRLAVTRRLRTRITELNRLPYPRALEWAAELLTGRHRADSTRLLFEPILSNRRSLGSSPPPSDQPGGPIAPHP